MKCVICFFLSTNVYWGWLILAKVLPVNVFSQENTMGIVPGICYIKELNKYLMSSVLSAGEIRMLFRCSQFNTHEKCMYTETMYLVNTYTVLCAGAGETAVHVRGGVPGFMCDTSILHNLEDLLQ